MRPFWKLAGRDLGILAAVTALWAAFASSTRGDGIAADALGLVLGLGFGLAAYLLHEWGHLLGALATASAVVPPDRLTSAYLFSFDSKRNSRRQFLVMSIGGFVVTGAAVWCALVPLDVPLQAARVARGAIALLASLTVVVEFPLVLWSIVSSSLPPVETFAPRPKEGPRTV